MLEGGATTHCRRPGDCKSSQIPKKNHIWRIALKSLGFSLLMAVVALLQDALAFGALGNLSGAPTADPM